MKDKDPFRPHWRTPKRTVKAARHLRKRMTPAEELLWQQLRGNQLDGWHFRRQHPVGRFIVDFFCAKAKLVVEVDGPIHKQQRAYDKERTELLETERGYHVIRFTNDEVLNDIESVLQRIREALANN
jgi:very-short-patch-repair endonuclease